MSMKPQGRQVANFMMSRARNMSMQLLVRHVATMKVKSKPTAKLQNQIWKSNKLGSSQIPQDDARNISGGEVGSPHVESVRFHPKANVGRSRGAPDQKRKR